MTSTDDSNRAELARIVREQTNDRLDILECLLEIFTGEPADCAAADRLDAAHTLLGMIIEFALLRQSPPDSAFAIVLSNHLDLFRQVVKFQVEVVEGRCQDVTVRQRVILAEQLRSRLRLVHSRDARGKFSRIFRHETRGGARIDRFLSNVIGNKVDGATPADVHNAKKLLDS